MEFYTLLLLSWAQVLHDKYFSKLTFFGFKSFHGSILLGNYLGPTLFLDGFQVTFLLSDFGKVDFLGLALPELGMPWLLPIILCLHQFLEALFFNIFQLQIDSMTLVHQRCLFFSFLLNSAHNVFPNKLVIFIIFQCFLGLVAQRFVIFRFDNRLVSNS